MPTKICVERTDTMKSVFILQHLNVLPGGEEDVKLIGVYRTRALAETAARRTGKMPGFCDHPSIIVDGHQGAPDGFYIDEYELDMDNWQEGFVTM